jgi:hypothetical protein
MLTGGSEINQSTNKDLYTFLKHSLNTIESNGSEKNDKLEDTFKNINKLISLQNNPEDIANIKNPFIKKLFADK